MKRWVLFALLLAGLLSSCATLGQMPGSTTPPAPRATLIAPTVEPTATSVPPTPTPTPVRAWVDPALPGSLAAMVSAALEGQGTERTPVEADASVKCGVGLSTEVAHWVYALVAPFPTLTDDISWSDVTAFWAGDEEALSSISEGDSAPTLYIAEESLRACIAILGEPSAGVPISITEGANLVDVAWEAHPDAWSIVPFDELEPRWKVLSIDGLSVLDKQLDITKYPLVLPVGVEGTGATELAAALRTDKGLITNRDTEQMTVLVMTGVTAMTRGIADRMEKYGVLHPAKYLREVLRSADITHISNEIPFAKNCPPPDFNQQSLTFCSAPKYMEILREVGTDVIELTGNHVKDYGAQAMLDTLEMYRQEGLPYFGGGANLEEARRPVILENNGNTFSFIGCNPVGPEYAWATADGPGSTPCDLEFQRSELARLKTEVDVPIATWQYWEFYFYEPTPQQQVDFRSMIDAGAEIVSGSQAHHPQAIEFYNGGFIHYGLGNLFFDQMWSLGTRQEMVDRHIIYNGRHISTQLLTFMLEDYSQPRPMTEDERRDLLTEVFKASGW